MWTLAARAELARENLPDASGFTDAEWGLIARFCFALQPPLPAVLLAWLAGGWACFRQTDQGLDLFAMIVLTA